MNFHFSGNFFIHYFTSLTERQAAYLKGDSTIQQLLYIINLIRKSWSKGCITQGIFLDVSAAFDKCWHKGLLEKLKQAKVESKCHTLFESYLSNREKCTVVDGIKSKFQEIKAGIPQGSKLGPLLRLLYVNDIVKDNRKYNNSLCGAVDNNKHFLLFCFLFQPERSEMLKKIKCYVPSFSCLSIAKQCEILLYGINLNNQLPDPRNRIITLTVQKFITKTNRFSSHYE